MFEGFEDHRVLANGITINAAVGGSGPPLLLLHGYPQSHVMWHAVAPGLAEHFTVVAADLRGDGDSDKPKGGGDHSAYSKRTMGQDMVELMAGLGHDRFSLAGHDRGGRVAYRLALDSPGRVEKLATLDIIPTYEQWEQLAWRGGIASFHWSFLAQPEPLPEQLIGSDPYLWLDPRMASWAAPGLINGSTRSSGAGWDVLRPRLTKSSGWVRSSSSSTSACSSRRTTQRRCLSRWLIGCGSSYDGLLPGSRWITRSGGTAFCELGPSPSGRCSGET